MAISKTIIAFILGLSFSSAFAILPSLASISLASIRLANIKDAQKNFSAILVDKKTNSLFLAQYQEGTLQVLKTFHATLGKAKGDKESEGDLRTPEGIYTFKSKLLPPKLKPKFGAMAFYMNYPNVYDSLSSRTGSDIMLHATNEPERLKKDYDSEGCVVVDNTEIKELESHIRLGLTPILIFPELTPEYFNPGKDLKLKSFFESWVKAWEGKEIGSYIDSYHPDFKSQGMDKLQWKNYKSGLNTKYDVIQIRPENILYYRHPKYSLITFKQNYASTLKGGRLGFRSHGTKILYVAEEEGRPKIISETYTSLLW